MSAHVLTIAVGIVAILVGAVLCHYRVPFTRARRAVRGGRPYWNGRQPSVWPVSMVSIGFIVLGLFAAGGTALGLLHPHYAP